MYGFVLVLILKEAFFEFFQSSKMVMLQERSLFFCVFSGRLSQEEGVEGGRYQFLIVARRIVYHFALSVLLILPLDVLVDFSHGLINYI
jgi:hypothetical protein